MIDWRHVYICYIFCVNYDMMQSEQWGYFWVVVTPLPTMIPGRGEQRGDYNLRRKKGHSTTHRIQSYGIHANMWGMLMVNDTMIMAYIGSYG